VDTLIDQSEAENLTVQLSKINANLANLESHKHHWESSVKLDAIGQVSHDELIGNGSYGSASARATNALIGLQVSIPLSTGGYREAKLEENIQLANQAQIDVDRTRQQIAQKIKQTYLQISIGKSRLTAISQALQAGEMRLDATRLGRQVGDRTTLDVLNAENEVAISQLNLVQEQVNLLMNQLQLSALIGRLDKDVLSEVNQFLTSEK
jgi:outer membrane protein